MAKQTSLSAVLVGATLAATGVLAMSVPQYVGHSKILRQVEDVQDEYDYIVVGGGTAGLTVANRLTESGERKSAFDNARWERLTTDAWFEKR